MTIKIDMTNIIPDDIYDFSLKLKSGGTVKQGDVVFQDFYPDEPVIIQSLKTTLGYGEDYDAKIVKWDDKKGGFTDYSYVRVNSLTKAKGAKAKQAKQAYDTWLNSPKARAYIFVDSSKGDQYQVFITSDFSSHDIEREAVWGAVCEKDPDRTKKAIQIYRKPEIDCTYGLPTHEALPILHRNDIRSLTCVETEEYIRSSELGYVDFEGNAYHEYSPTGRIMLLAKDYIEEKTIISIKTSTEDHVTKHVKEIDNLQLIMQDINGLTREVNVKYIESIYNHSKGEFDYRRVD